MDESPKRKGIGLRASAGLVMLLAINAIGCGGGDGASSEPVPTPTSNSANTTTSSGESHGRGGRVKRLRIKPRMPPNPETYRDGKQDVRISYPRDWVRLRESLTPRRAGAELAVSNSKIEVAPGAACSDAPDQPQVQIGPRDALIHLTSTADAGAGGPGSPKKPRRFSLFKQVRASDTEEPRGEQLFPWPCLNEAGIIGTTRFFGASGRLFDVTAIVGKSASERTVRETLGVLQSLRFYGRDH